MIWRTCSLNRVVADAQPAPPGDAAAGSCTGAESFALMVLGHSMAPEFNEGEIIIIEPEGLARWRGSSAVATSS